MCYYYCGKVKTSISKIKIIFLNIPFYTKAFIILEAHHCHLVDQKIGASSSFNGPFSKQGAALSEEHPCPLLVHVGQDVCSCLFVPVMEICTPWTRVFKFLFAPREAHRELMCLVSSPNGIFKGIAHLKIISPCHSKCI